MIFNQQSGGGGGNAVVTGRLDSQEITVYGETDNGIIEFDYSTDYNVRLDSMLVCLFWGPYTWIPSGLEYVGEKVINANTILVLKVTGDFVIYGF